MRGNETPKQIMTNICTGVWVHDVITSANFYDYRLRGLGVAGGSHIFGLSIDLRRRPYNTLALYRASVDSHHEWAFVDCRTTSPNKSKMADGDHIEFRKC